jgi:hypothetical protein
MDETSNQELDEELIAARANALRLYGESRRRAIYATLAFLLSCSSVVPFLYGHFLHKYWDVFGKYLVLLSMGLVVPFVIFTGFAVNTWIYKRNIESIQEDDD